MADAGHSDTPSLAPDPDHAWLLLNQPPCKARADIRLSKITPSPFGRLCIWGHVEFLVGWNLVLRDSQWSSQNWEKTCQVRCMKNHPAEGGTDSVLCLAHALSALASYPMIWQCMKEAKSKTTCISAGRRKKLTEQTQAAPRQAHIMGCAKLKRSPHSGLEAAGHFP